MPKYSNTSLIKLASCDPKLQDVFNRVILRRDCIILSGRREELEQNELVRNGRSELKYPLSKHNKKPQSTAIDTAPFPIDWENIQRFVEFGGYVLGMADAMNIKLVWGGHWKSLKDYGHFELVEETA